MRLMGGIKDLSKRVVLDYGKLEKLAGVLRDELNLRTVVTIGTFDMIHIGHSRYLERAKNQGDFLIVGVDSDRAVKSYKGPLRPMIPENERLEMLLHTRYVDLATLIDDIDDDGSWRYGLLKAVRPSVFIAVEDSYPDEQLADIKQHCGEVIVLPRQASTSTSEVIRRAMVVQAKPLSEQLRLMAERLDRGEI